MSIHSTPTTPTWSTAEDEQAPEPCPLDVWGLISSGLVDNLDRVQLRNELDERHIPYQASQRETNPANVLSNPESVVTVMLGKSSSVFADLKAAEEALKTGGDLGREETTKRALVEMRKSNRTTIPRVPLPTPRSGREPTGKQSKCEKLLEGRVADCTASRQSLNNDLKSS